MFDVIRKRLTTRRSLRQIARLDRHLKDDIGLGHFADPDHHEPLLMLTRGPFERYTA